ncbi:hypothetical protein [uncultured Duncaniella sp.]|uniref:hypothetical protein n=1 Tax=uncultured Duncaniella sp. TaxID=2768039 RepID=UPI0025A93E8B|nr:hypothetical protein [uncultured Duncaniella sp.]
MKLTDKRFWIVWPVLLLLAIVSCMAGGWNEDTALLGAAYMVSLLSTWLCHRIRPRVSFGNLIVMLAYNAILSYNLVFNSRYGAGLTWWFYALLLNIIHSIAVLLFIRYQSIHHRL